jgi:hypothetical protein
MAALGELIPDPVIQLAESILAFACRNYSASGSSNQLHTLLGTSTRGRVGDPGHSSHVTATSTIKLMWPSKSHIDQHNITEVHINHIKNP